jgi:hypothetical protein
MPIILASQEAKIRRTMVQSQPRQNSSQDPILKIFNIRIHKKKAGGVVQEVEHQPRRP